MPEYTIRDPQSGRTLTVRGDSPPTEQELEQLFAAPEGAAALQSSHERQPRMEPPPTIVGGGGRGTGLDVNKSERRMTAALPTLGAMGGAALGALTAPVTGPVGAAGGAAMGGALGEAIRQPLAGEQDDVGKVLTEGLMQGSMQAVGPVVNAAGKGLYKGGAALMPRTLKQQFPKLAESGYREGVALTRRGAAKAGREMSASAKQADAMITAAEQSGASRVSPRAVVSELRPIRDKAARAAQLGMADDVPAIGARARAFAAHNKGGISLTDAQALKREAQDLATAAYRAEERGAPINTLDTLMNEAQARGLRKEIERLVPGVGAVNTRTQELMGLEKAAEQASQTGHVLSRLGGATAGGGIAGGWGAIPAAAGAGAGLLLTTPGGLTSAGVGLKRLVPIASHLPSAVRLAILARLLGEE